MPQTIPAPTASAERVALNRQLAQMLKGGVIMDVTTPEQARIAEAAGAARRYGAGAHPRRHPRGRRRFPHERPGHDQAASRRPFPSPSWRNAASGTSPRHRSSRPSTSTTSTNPKCSRRLTTSTTSTRRVFAVPFVCGARDLGEALRRIAEGATMIRTKGEPGTGDVVQAVRHMRRMNAEIRRMPEPARRRAVRSGEGAASAGGAAARGARGRQAARRELRRRRHRHPGRRGPYDAAGRRGRLRGQRYLQVGRPGPSAPRPS